MTAPASQRDPADHRTLKDIPAPDVYTDAQRWLDHGTYAMTIGHSAHEW